MQTIGRAEPLSILQGLSEEQAVARRAKGLGNDVKLRTSRTYGEILQENLLTFFNLVLFGIGLLFLLLGSPTEAIITSGVGLLNVMLAVVQEVRAKRKLDQIALLTRPKATVLREGQEKAVDPSEIVLGDILVVGPGDQIVVDGTIVGDDRMDVDESLLTGETDLVPKETGDGVLSGSFCVNGRAAYEAQRVGSESFVNKLTSEARTFTRKYTPLQREVDLFVRVLLVIIVFYGLLLVIATAVTQDLPLIEAVRAASVVMGIAPSSMFLMIVVAYALGALRIADKGALVQQANSVESLCNTTVLCLDKTGTLTANRIQLDRLQPLGEESDANTVPLQRVLGTYARSLSASNPTSQAIAEAYDGEAYPAREEVSFSSARKWSALTFDEQNVQGLYVLGAPEILQPYLSLETRSARDVVAQCGEWMARGLRVLLFAHRSGMLLLHDDEGEPTLPGDLHPLCLLGFRDELRPEARETLEGFRQTGIELKIISGDHPHTVAALAQQVGLGTPDSPLQQVAGPELEAMDGASFTQAVAKAIIFGRITPQQKERIVRALRDQGHYVAMTGDGVNDVLALKQANLGIAMQSGSQATRSVSDIVLLNDSFGVLPAAFAEGQRIVNGMTDILRIYLVRILGLALLIAAISMLGAGFPFSATQSSFISLVSLSIPAFGLALWARPGPTPKVNLTRKLMHFVVPAVLVTTAAGLAVYLFFFAKTGGDVYYAQQTLTYAMVVMGLLLVVFVEPPTRAWAGGDQVGGDWRPTLLVVALLTGFGLFLAIPPLREMYGIILLAKPADYLVILLVVVIWALALRYTWRARLVDRYLNVDLGGTTGASAGNPFPSRNSQKS